MTIILLTLDFMANKKMADDFAIDKYNLIINIDCR
jgi:hypothetical protein